MGSEDISAIPEFGPSKAHLRMKTESGKTGEG